MAQCAGSLQGEWAPTLCDETMDFVDIIILGVLQGLTEFLPISSSGHLVVAAALLEAESAKPFTNVVEVNIILHLGTLLAVLVFYARPVMRMLGTDRNVIPRLIVATLPAVVVGLPLKKLAPQLLESPLLAGFMLPLTGALLIWASRIAPGSTQYTKLSYRQVFILGLFQAVAILPGISRSGATIAAGLAVGLDRENAATFAFLMAIPTIAGAGVLELVDFLQTPTPCTVPGLLLLGAGISFLVGLVSLWWLVQWIQRGRLADFAYWCIPLGIVVIAWQLWQLLGH